MLRERVCTVDIQQKVFTVLEYMQLDITNINIVCKEYGEFVELSGYTVEAFFETPSLKVFNKSCTILNNIITAELDTNITGEVGRVNVEFVISKNGKVVTSFTIYFNINRSIPRNNIVQADPQWDIVKELIDIRNEKFEPTLRELTAQLDAKIADYESRFNTMIAGGTTSEASIKAEVIDARKGKTTLGEKITSMDTDIANLKNAVDTIFEDFEG